MYIQYVQPVTLYSINTIMYLINVHVQSCICTRTHFPLSPLLLLPCPSPIRYRSAPKRPTRATPSPQTTASPPRTGPRSWTPPPGPTPCAGCWASLSPTPPPLALLLPLLVAGATGECHSRRESRLPLRTFCKSLRVC